MLDMWTPSLDEARHARGSSVRVWEGRPLVKQGRGGLYVVITGGALAEQGRV